MSSWKKLSPMVALVTGASSGIGLEFSRQLAALGHHLVLVSNQDEMLRQVRDELAEKHIQWAEEAIWIDAYTRYYTHRSLATWYQVEEAY